MRTKREQEILLKEIQELTFKKFKLEKELQELYSQKQRIINPIGKWSNDCAKIQQDIVSKIDYYLLKLKKYELLSENDLQMQINDINEKIDYVRGIERINLEKQKTLLLRQINGLREYLLIRTYVVNISEEKKELESIDLYSVSITTKDKTDYISSQVNKLGELVHYISGHYSGIIRYLNLVINTIKENEHGILFNDIPYSSDIIRLSSDLELFIELKSDIYFPHLNEKDLRESDESINKHEYEIERLQNEICKLHFEYGKEGKRKFSSDSKKAVRKFTLRNSIVSVVIILLIIIVFKLPDINSINELLQYCVCSDTVICIMQVILFIVLILFEIRPINNLFEVGKLELLIVKYEVDLENTINSYSVDFSVNVTVIKDFINDKYDGFFNEVKNSSKILKRRKKND